MADNISAISSVGNALTEPPRNGAVAPASASQSSAQSAEALGQQRLVIEPVSSHRFVYKVLDTNTGEVIRQLPNEHVEKMITDPSYKQGGLVKTSA